MWLVSGRVGGGAEDDCHVETAVGWITGCLIKWLINDAYNRYAPENWRPELQKVKVWKMIFHFKEVIFRFQALVFWGVMMNDAFSAPGRIFAGHLPCVPTTLPRFPGGPACLAHHAVGDIALGAGGAATTGNICGVLPCISSHWDDVWMVNYSNFCTLHSLEKYSWVKEIPSIHVWKPVVAIEMTFGQLRIHGVFVGGAPSSNRFSLLKILFDY